MKKHRQTHKRCFPAASTHEHSSAGQLAKTYSNQLWTNTECRQDYLLRTMANRDRWWVEILGNLCNHHDLMIMMVNFLKKLDIRGLALNIEPRFLLHWAKLSFPWWIYMYLHVFSTENTDQICIKSTGQSMLASSYSLLAQILFFASISFYLSYLPTPLLGQDMTQGQFLSGV